MKIKEVAARTGLTEKAIRFYEGKKLITPQTYEVGGRTFREYTEENVRCLTEIAVLRRAFFSVGQISEMLQNPARTGDVFREYRENLRSDYATMTPLIAHLDAAEVHEIRDMGDIVSLLGRQKETNAPPPRELRCSAVDEIPPGERAEAYRVFLKRQAWRDRRDACFSALARGGKILACVVCGLLVLYMLYFVLTNIRIMRTVHVTLDALEWQEGQPDSAVPCTLTLEGEIRDYLFARDTAKLYLTISTYPSIEDYGVPCLRLSRPHGADEWVAGSLFDSIYTEGGESYLLHEWWMDEASGVAFFLLSEGTGNGSYTYDPDSRSRVISVGVRDTEEAQTLIDYVRLTERTGYEKRMAELKKRKAEIEAK